MIGLVVVLLAACACRVVEKDAEHVRESTLCTTLVVRFRTPRLWLLGVGTGAYKNVDNQPHRRMERAGYEVAVLATTSHMGAWPGTRTLSGRCFLSAINCCTRPYSHAVPL